MITESEGYLLVWAIIATIASGIYSHRARQMGRALGALIHVMHDLAEGKAEVKLVGEDKIQVKKIKE